MPGAPENRPRSTKGRPPKDPACTADNVLRQLREDPDWNHNPVLACILAAMNHHRPRHHAQVTAYLEAAIAILESCELAAAQDANLDPLDVCDCGHARARHVDGEYCTACLYKLNGAGWYGCKGFHDAEPLPDTDRRCACGRMYLGTQKMMRDPDYPRVHWRDRGKACYELRTEGPSKRPLRVALKPVEREL